MLVYDAGGQRGPRGGGAQRQRQQHEPAALAQHAALAAARARAREDVAARCAAPTHYITPI